MKGKSKYIVPLLLAGVTATAGVVTTIEQQQQTVVQAAENTLDAKSIDNISGATISVTKGFADSYDLGTSIDMPDVSVSGIDGEYTLTYKITRGSTTFKTIKSTDADKTFTPSYTGSYSVTIEVSQEGTIVSQLTGLTINVKKSEATISLPVNSQYVIPAKLPKGNTNGLTIPMPTVYTLDENGEDKEVENPNLVVKLITPSDDNPITLTATTVGTGADAHQVYKVDSTKLNTAGTYQIRYEYYESNQDEDVLISHLETNFQVVNNYTAPKKLYLKLRGTVPSTGDVNTEISLPEVVVLDSSTATDGINAHVTVKITKLKADGSDDGEPVEITDYEKYTWTPTEEGNYVVSYQADLNSLYGNVSSELYMPATIIKVVDEANPTVMPTYAYTVTNDGKVATVDTDNNDTFNTVVNEDTNLEDVFENRRYEVPSVVVKSSDGYAYVNLPAIYGTDNATENVGDMTLSREIVGNNISKIYVEHDDVYDEQNNLTEAAVHYYDNATIKLKTAGNYEIRYIAKDEKGNTTRATYSLVVKEQADVADAKTTLNLNIGVSSVTNKDTLTFSKPSATNNYDSYLETKVWYELYNNQGIVTGSYTELTEDDVNAEGKYAINIGKLLTQWESSNITSIRVYTSATADNTLDGYGIFNPDNNVDGVSGTTLTKSKDIIIRDVSKDESPATILIGGVDANYDNWNVALLQANKEILFDYNSESKTSEVTGIDKTGYAVGSNGIMQVVSSGENLAPFDQGTSILKLPDVTFNDYDENLKISLIIKDRFGNPVTKETYEKIEKDGYNYTVTNASFRLSASGVYTVTYRAEDSNGNVVSKTFGIKVNDKTKPSIVIDDQDKYGLDVEVGSFFEVPVGTLYKDQEVQPGEVYWTLSYSDGALAEITPTGFTPLTEGTFYITYIGSDSLENTQVLQDNDLFYVNAVDTTAPEFNADSSLTLSPTLVWDPSTEGTMDVKIPVVFATDPNLNNPVDVICTVESPDGTKVTIKDIPVEDGESPIIDMKYFTATAQGIYTIKYTATDDANNTVTMTKEIAIGDCEGPTIKWDNEDENIPTEIKLGNSWSLPLSKLTLSDNILPEDDDTYLQYLKDNLTIKLIKPDGTTVVESTGTEGENYTWKFEETGSYTLNITVKDKAGMSNTYKYTINVPSEEVDDKEISSVLGTVLIVVSVVILGGVVLWVVLSSRKKSPAKAGNSRKKK